MFTFLITLFSTNLALAAPEDRQPLFQSTDTLELKLVAPFASDVFDAPDSSDNYYEPLDKSKKAKGEIIYKGKDGKPRSVAVEVRLRGKDRLSSCVNPPLKLSFKHTDKAQLDESPFRGLKELKLARFCDRLKDSDMKGAEGPHAIRFEYLAYKIFQEWTPLSFGVRYAKITYVDSSQKMKTKVLDSFLLEGEDDIAVRTGMEQVKDEREKRLEAKDFDAYAKARATLFQSMIGNNDFGFGEAVFTNAIGLRNSSSGLVTPVPYDLDRTQSSYNLGVTKFRPLVGGVFDWKEPCEWMARGPLVPLSTEQQDQLVKEMKERSKTAVEIIRRDPVLTEKEKIRPVAYYQGFRSKVDLILQKARATKCEYNNY